MAEPPVTIAGVLRNLRTEAGLTQEELAEASGVSLRSVSDLERGRVTIPQKDTVRLLADALHLIGAARARFEAIARGRAVADSAAATRTLPHDIASFTGRQRELRELVDAAAGAGQVVSIHAIGGMAGIGKTAFAVHAAHLLADRFPAGQIFLPLHGHTPGQEPVDPMDALASLLLTAGVAAAQIPPGLEARMALWRDRLADQQLLLILDDAVGSEQVLPLLPGAGGSMVLITSRRHLSSLDATAISLDTLPTEEAAGLLIRLAGRPGLSQADPGVREIIRLCGSLPLAIGMVGRQLHHHPAWSAGSRAAELAAARDRLELMATENVSVAAAFDLSYAHLAHDHRRLFRRLGLHPSTDIDAYAAAALEDVGLAAARQSLEALYDQYLLTEPTPGRYRMHDLIREHARAVAARDDHGDDRDQATARLLDYYQHTAARAEALLARQACPAPAARTAPAAAPALTGPGQALAWARAERANLLACLNYATGTGQYARTVALTAAIASMLRYDGPWAEAVTRHATAVRAAWQAGDRLGQANALNDLGDLGRLTGDYPGALRDLEEAVAIYRDLGNRLGQAYALNNLGDLVRLTGNYPAAARDQEAALALYRGIGNRLGQAHALRGQGAVRRAAGDYPGAARDLAEALAILRDIGASDSVAEVLNEFGILHRVRGDLVQAGACHQEALDLAREDGIRWDEAHALAGLGRCALAADRIGEAEGQLRRALEIFQQIGTAEAAHVAAELDALPPLPSGSPALHGSIATASAATGRPGRPRAGVPGQPRGHRGP